MVVQGGRRDLAAGGQDAQRNGQIKTTRVLGQVGWRQVDGDALVGRKLQPAVLEGTAHALARLLHFGVGQPHQRESGQAVGQMHFHRHSRGVQSKQGAAGYQCEAHAMKWPDNGLRKRG